MDPGGPAQRRGRLFTPLSWRRKPRPFQNKARLCYNTSVMALALGQRRMLLRKVTSYAWHTGKLSKTVHLAVVSDLHDEEYDDLWSLLQGADCLLVPGDLVNRYRQSADRGLAFLEEAAKRLPTFFSLGNHEMNMKNRPALWEAFRQSSATFLLNGYARFGELWIGGWYRPYLLGMEDMLEEFEALEGCKVLLCHRPEDYRRHMQGRQLDLVLAGHAHGGQIRIGKQGLYAPGQGFFPKLTKGVAQGRMIISAGASNPVKMPRWGNPCEVLRIALN